MINQRAPIYRYTDPYDEFMSVFLRQSSSNGHILCPEGNHLLKNNRLRIQMHTDSNFQALVSASANDFRHSMRSLKAVSDQFQ